MQRIAVLVCLVSISALAQVNVDVNDPEVPEVHLAVPGAQVDVGGGAKARPRAPEGTATTATPAAQPPPRVFGAEAFELDARALNGAEAGVLKVLTPEGAQAQVWGDQGFAGTFTVPFSFKGAAQSFYRVILTAPDGALLYDRRVELPRWYGVVMHARSQPAAAAPIAAAPPAGDGDFDAVLSAVQDASFSADKLGVIETAAGSRRFTVEQVGQLVDALAASGDKVKVVELTRAKLVDRQNGFKLLEHFAFSGDKQKVKALLK